MRAKKLEQVLGKVSNQPVSGVIPACPGGRMRNRPETPILKPARPDSLFAKNLHIAVASIHNDDFHALKDPCAITFQNSVKRRALMQQNAGDSGLEIVAPRSFRNFFQLVGAQVPCNRADVDELHKASAGSIPQGLAIYAHNLIFRGSYSGACN